KAIKNISVNEPCFTGHFPGEPILPGVLILEALAQSMGILAFKTHELKGGELFYFAGIDEARFKRPVLPGDQMELNVQVIKERRGITAFTGIATVNGEVACEAKLMCARR
ncbi:MAG: 3-hydroxyacyl-ACP dehydratase FabZ, partial [Haemophilus parainfluenzae]|nr:3-hydroxyacyl-ACP dehydratase FabZ [Haemophilus parainfluenzae]